jgi:hypothetical protein
MIPGKDNKRQNTKSPCLYFLCQSIYLGGTCLGIYLLELLLLSRLVCLLSRIQNDLRKERYALFFFLILFRFSLVSSKARIAVE